MLRAVLARNLAAELDRKYPLFNATKRNQLLGKAVGVSPETIRRILNQEVGPSTDTVELIAEELDVPPNRLLQPSSRIRRKFEE